MLLCYAVIWLPIAPVFYNNLQYDSHNRHCTSYSPPYRMHILANILEFESGRCTEKELWMGGFRRKEMFYLTTHSTLFLFTVIWRRAYGKGPLRKRERKPAAATLAILSDWQQRFLYMHHPTDRIAHTTAFGTPVVEHCLEREIAQWVHPMKDRSDDPSHHERTLLPRSYISLTGRV